MYGMVNKAIREFIEQEQGSDGWERIKADAGFDQDAFISMEQYPDELSVALVVSASQAMGCSVPELLEDIGRYWIEFALRSDYGHLIRMAGDTLPELLIQLDDMHTRIGQTFTELRPPSFWCTEVTEDALILHYASTRGGLLAPMVVGLVEGLAIMLNVECSVERIASTDEGAEHDQFHVRYAPAGSTLDDAPASTTHARA